MPRFAVTLGPDGLMSLRLRNPTPIERKFIVEAVTCRWMDDPRYELGQRSGAFLQCNYEDFVLVEFWQTGYEPFVQWLNDNFDAYAAREKEEELS